MDPEKLVCDEETCTRMESIGDNDNDDDAAAEKELTEDNTAERTPKEQALSGRPQKKKGKGSSSSSSSSAHALIKTLHTQQELDLFVNQHSAVVVEFKTTWCGACKSIEELYEQLAAAHVDSVKAAQVVCDKNRETKKLASLFGVSSYPVFCLFEEGGDAGRWNGADRGKLEKAFERLGSDGRSGGRKKGGRRRK